MRKEYSKCSLYLVGNRWYSREKIGETSIKKEKITFILTALCAVIYLLQNIGFEEPIMDLFHYPAYSWEDQEVWRYFTHAIVHLSVPHILFNLSWFWLFGGAIERRFGSLHFYY